MSRDKLILSTRFNTAGKNYHKKLTIDIVMRTLETYEDSERAF